MKGLIAVDLDDVLRQTNQAIADCMLILDAPCISHSANHYKPQGHNKEYGTEMTIEDFHCESKYIKPVN